jgi:hypothetical protein
MTQRHKKEHTMDYSMIVSDDAFRNAFGQIAQVALPYMALDGYVTDLLYDAARASNLLEGERFYLLVRKLGTNCFTYGDDAVAHCDPRMSDGQAVLKVTRTKFDRFRVELIYVRPEVAHA